MSYFGYKSMDGQGVADLRKSLSQPLAEAASTFLENVEKRKEEALTLQRESSKAVRNSPYGLSTSAQQAALNLATTGAGRLQKLNKDYNSGTISFKQYKFAQQNIVDETLSQYDVLTKSSALSKAKYEAIAKGEEDPMSVYIGDKLQKESNLSDLTPDYTPEGILVYKKPDGTELSGREVVQMQTFRLQKYNYLSGVNDFMKEVGTREALGFGKIATTTSVLNNPNFKEAKRKYIESQLANPYTVQSILGQTASDLNSVYTDNPEEAERDPNKILIRPGQNALGFEPVITEHHKEIVRKELESQIETRVSSVLQLKPEGQKTENKPTEGEKKKAIILDQIYAAYTGNEDDRGTFLKTLANTVPGIQNGQFVKEGDVMYLRFEKISTPGSKAVEMKIPMSDINSFGQVVGPLFGIQVGRGELGPDQKAKDAPTKKVGETVKEAIPRLVSLIDASIVPNIRKKTAANNANLIDETAKAFASHITKKGYEVVSNVKGGYGYFTVLIPGVKDPVRVDVGNDYTTTQGTAVTDAMNKVLATIPK